MRTLHPHAVPDLFERLVLRLTTKFYSMPQPRT
jgi:hypothetical protein